MISKIGVFRSLLLTAVVLISATNGMFEKDKGKNEWALESLGQVNDLVFIGYNQAYTLSKDSLLTLFDTVEQKVQWKTQLPQGLRESYKLRHKGRNLLIHSDHRASMINSAGNVIWDQPLTGDGKAVVEMFNVGNDVFSVFVKQDQVTIYKQTAQKGQFQILKASTLELPAEYDAVFEPLQLIFSSEDGGLALVARVGTSIDGQFSQVAVFSIDYIELHAEILGSKSIKNFSCTSRTKNQIIFHKSDGSGSIAMDPFKTLDGPDRVFSQILSTSINDDFIFEQQGQHLNSIDLSVEGEKNLFMTVPSDCSVKRPRESEEILPERQIDSVVLALDCRDKF